MRKNAEKRELSRLSRIFDKIWEKKTKNAPSTATIVPSENKFSSVLTRRKGLRPIYKVSITNQVDFLQFPMT